MTEIFAVQGAQTVLEKQVCDKMKKQNAMKHTTQTRRQHLEDLKLLILKPQDNSPLPDSQKGEEEKVEIDFFLGIFNERFWILKNICPIYYYCVPDV